LKGNDKASRPRSNRPYSAKPKRTLAERHGEVLFDEEVADKLACTARRVRKLYYAGELPGFYVGGLLRFHVDDVNAYLAGVRANGRADA
jgi:excisionase family DNA binding protein